jgi:hypothetical protein
MLVCNQTLQTYKEGADIEQLGAKQEVATFDEIAPTQSKGTQLSFWQVPGKYFDRLPSTETFFSNFL